MRDYDYQDDDSIKREKLKKWTALAVLLLLAVIVVGIRLTDITVKGSTRYSPEELEEIIFPDYMDKNTLYCLIKDRLRPHKEIPFIEDYDIQLTGPFSADLVIYEKSIIGYVRYMSSNMYFDKDGIVVENSNEMIEDVPEITGLRFGHIVLNKELPVSDSALFGEIMNITQQLDYYGIDATRIDFDSMRNVTVFVSGGNIEVKMGSSENIDSKISILNDMLPNLSCLSGTLHIENYSDDDDGGIYTFEKKKESPEESSEATENEAL